MLLGRAGQDNTPPEHYQTLVCIIWSLCFSVRHLFYVWNFLTACLVEFFSRTAGIPVFWAWLIVIRLINLDLNKLIVLSCEAQILSENAWQNSLRSIWLVTLWCDLWRIFNRLANGCGVMCCSVLWGSDIVRERSTTVQCHFCQNGIERDAFELRVIPRMHDWQTLFEKCHPFLEVFLSNCLRLAYQLFPFSR